MNTKGCLLASVLWVPKFSEIQGEIKGADGRGRLWFLSTSCLCFGNPLAEVLSQECSLFTPWDNQKEMIAWDFPALHKVQVNKIMNEITVERYF